jgi:hypothetical protein
MQSCAAADGFALDAGGVSLQEFSEELHLTCKLGSILWTIPSTIQVPSLHVTPTQIWMQIMATYGNFRQPRVEATTTAC